MTTTFSSLIGDAAFADGELSAHIPDDWMQGRTTYGGLSAALCLEAARRAIGDLPPLRSAMVSFIGPTGGDVTGRARLLRQGKSVTFVEAELHGEKGLATRCEFAFGASRSSVFDNVFVETPAMPGPEHCEDFIPQGMGPPFARHFDTKLARGARPVTGSSEYDHFIWVRHKDREATGPVALLALADMPPPALLPMFREFAPISSMTWMVNFTHAEATTEDGWWLLETKAENGAEGYSSQDMFVWNRAGDLVIAGRQSVAIFA